MIDVCFLALGPPTQIDFSVSIIRNIEAHSSLPVRYHLLVDRPRKELRAQMHARAAWKGVPKRMVSLHSVKRLGVATKALYKGLASTATGPGPIYLYKPLLHLVLPASLSKVIVLDTDLFVFGDVAALWAHFATFTPQQMIGVAAEQCPSYQEVRALGGLGLNGGVQLLALDAMRASPHYTSLMHGYAAAAGAWRKKGARAPPMKPGGIGWLGDQTLYSWMSVNGTGAREVFNVLPCGWNRQIGTHMAGWPGFWERHACDSRCNLLHGNYVGHKKFMEALKHDPSGRTCAKTVRDARVRDPAFRPKADAKMLDVVEQCCKAQAAPRAGRRRRRAD